MMTKRRRRRSTWETARWTSRIRWTSRTRKWLLVTMISKTMKRAKRKDSMKRLRKSIETKKIRVRNKTMRKSRIWIIKTIFRLIETRSSKMRRGSPMLSPRKARMKR